MFNHPLQQIIRDVFHVASLLQSTIERITIFHSPNLIAGFHGSSCRLDRHDITSVTAATQSGGFLGMRDVESKIAVGD